MSLTPRPKLKSYHKKRHAQHHSHSRGYLKTYWPYLPMLAIILGGIGFNSLLVSSSAVLSAQSNFSSSSLLQCSNTTREANQRSDLKLNSDLTNAAESKANDMVKLNFWSHTSPSGQTPWSYITASGYSYQAAGENLAYGFSNACNVVSAWLNSPSHRANLLSPNYEDVGFGVSESNNFLGQGPKVIVVAEYGEPAGAVSNAMPSSVLGASQPVSRLTLWSGLSNAYVTLLVGLLSGAAITILVIRHTIRLNRLLRYSEAFISEHPFLDICFVLVATAGLLAIHSAGFIS